MSTASFTRFTHGLRRVRVHRLTHTQIAGIALAIIVLVCAFLWFRSSSLVGVRKVTVTGVGGADAAKVRSQLVSAGKKMTTLNATVSKLENAVSSPYIAGISISTHFPHGLTVNVREHLLVAMVGGGSSQVDVDGAGETLPHSHAPNLPTVSSLTDRGALSVLGAAPYQLLAHIGSAATEGGRGVVVHLRNGPELIFGSGAQLPLKWQAAVGVLANSASRGASYIDLSDPNKPAAGSAGSKGR